MPGPELEDAVVQLLNDAETLRRTVRLYSDVHPAQAPARERIRVSVARLLDLTPKATLTISPDRFAWNNETITPPAGSPAGRLVGNLLQLGVAAIRIDLAAASDGLIELVRLLARLREPPSEADRQELFAAQVSLAPGIELVPIDLSALQLVGDETARDAEASRALWLEVAERLSREGGLALPGRTAAGTLTPGLVLELIGASPDVEALFDHIFRQLGEVLRSAPPSRRRVVSADVRAFLAELVGLLDQDRRRLAVATAARHLLAIPGVEDASDPLIAADPLLDAVELILIQGHGVPPGVQRVLYRMAAPRPDAESDLPDELVVRARRLLSRIPGGAFPPPAEPPPVSPPLAPIQWDSLACVRELREALSERALRAHLVTVLTEAASLWQADAVSASAAIRLAEEFVATIDMGDFENALTLAPSLAATASAEARRLAHNTGARAVTRAFRTSKREFHPTLAAILTALGEQALPAILEAIAGEESLAVRKRLLEVVARQREKAIPYLRPMLEDSRWYVVRNAVFLLRRLGDRGSLPLIRAKLTGARPQVVAEILKSLVAFEHPEWHALLVQHLDSDNDEYRRTALAVASRIPHPKVVRSLVERLRQLVGVRLREPFSVELVHALGRLKDPAALPVLRQVLELKQWLMPFSLSPIRQEAAAAVARIHTPEARQLAVELSSDRDRAVAQTARGALSFSPDLDEEEE